MVEIKVIFKPNRFFYRKVIVTTQLIETVWPDAVNDTFVVQRDFSYNSKIKKKNKRKIKLKILKIK